MVSKSLSRRAGTAMAQFSVAAGVTAASLCAASLSFGQGFSDNFNSPNNTGYSYTNGSSLSGSNGWDTNDPDKTPTTMGYSGEYVGQSDYVGAVVGYTPGSTTGAPPTVGNGDFWAYLGGGEHGTTSGYVLPGVSTVYLYHSFSVASSSAYAFNTDMSIASSASYPNRDSFGWTFLSSASGTAIGSNLFSLNFTPGTGSSVMDISYSVNGGAPVPTGDAIMTNSIYHLTISVNVTAKTAAITLTPTSGSPLTVATVSLATINPALVQEVAATWKIGNTTTDANGGITGAGGNELLFNNYAVTVPEPSTWAAIALGATATAGVLSRRRRRA